MLAVGWFWLLLLVWLCCLFFVLLLVTIFPIPSCLHTKDVKHFPRLSERALDLLWRLMSLVRDVVVTLLVMDCLYPRDPPQPVRKKKQEYTLNGTSIMPTSYIQPRHLVSGIHPITPRRCMYLSARLHYPAFLNW